RNPAAQSACRQIGRDRGQDRIEDVEEVRSRTDSPTAHGTVWPGSALSRAAPGAAAIGGLVAGFSRLRGAGSPGARLLSHAPPAPAEPFAGLEGSRYAASPACPRTPSL